MSKREYRSWTAGNPHLARSFPPPEPLLKPGQSFLGSSSSGESDDLADAPASVWDLVDPADPCAAFYRTKIHSLEPAVDFLAWAPLTPETPETPSTLASPATPTNSPASLVDSSSKSSSRSDSVSRTRQSFSKVCQKSTRANRDQALAATRLSMAGCNWKTRSSSGKKSSRVL